MIVASGVLLRAAIGRTLIWPPSASDVEVSVLATVVRFDVELPSDSDSVCWVVREFSRSVIVVCGSSCTGACDVAELMAFSTGCRASVTWFTVLPSCREPSGVLPRTPFSSVWAFTATEVRIARALRELGEAGVNVGIYARYIIGTMTALPPATHLMLTVGITDDLSPAVGAYTDPEELASAVLTSPGPSIVIQILKSEDLPTQEIP